MQKYSEHNEEKIITDFFKKNPPKYKTFVDVGASGIKGSNTYKLIKKGWKGILIEGDKEKAAQINFGEVIQAYVTKNNLDKLLPTTNIDFLNIDIDSFDYEVWKNTKLKPALVCIEINQFELDINVINYDPSYSLYKYTNQRQGYGGATLGLMNKLAKEKGYCLLTLSWSNAFYIKK